jgi:hypothetical protein
MEIDIRTGIKELTVRFLSDNHGDEYEYEGFVNIDVVEVYAFSKADKTEKICMMRLGVNDKNEQVYISNLFTPENLRHNGIGKKLIRIVFEIGRGYGFDTVLVDLIDSFRRRMIERGALVTDQFDQLFIDESTRLVD